MAPSSQAMAEAPDLTKEHPMCMNILRTGSDSSRGLSMNSLIRTRNAKLPNHK